MSDNRDRLFHSDRAATILYKLENEYEKIDPNDTDLRFIIYNIITRIKSSANDIEAMHKVMEYVLHLPIQPTGKNEQSYGNYLHVSEPLQAEGVKKLPSTKPLSGANLNYLNDLFSDFLKIYKPVSHQWHFDYTKRENGEILTPGIAEWKTEMTDTSGIEENKAVPDFKRTATINGNEYNNLENEAIHQGIDSLCNELNDTDTNKKLFASWLKKCGGQSTFGFISALINENHFGENINIATAKRNVMDWSIINNQLHFTYSANVNSVMELESGKIYVKPKGKTFITTIVDIELCDTHPEQFDPLVKINANVVLTIENIKNKPTVVPKLVGLQLDATACMTDSGKILLQDPNKNAALKEMLTGDIKVESGMSPKEG